MALRDFDLSIALLAVVLGASSCRPTPSSQILAGGLPSGPTTVVNGILVAPNTLARSAADAMKSSGDPNTKYMETVANNTVGVWYADWSGDIQTAVKDHASKALSNNAIAVMVAYNIPSRDCGSFSAGGTSASGYRTWISQFAASVGQAKAIIILEPDALTLTDCLSTGQRSERYELLHYAVKEFRSKAPNAKVYIDAGHPAWLPAEKAASLLQEAGVASADGFAINTSNYHDNATNITYGNKIRAIINKNFVIDTSRNGRGAAPNNEWCNPNGRGLGTAPTTKTNTPGVDAFLWIKAPGESDGTCNGGPAAGQFWRERAIELAKNANLKIPGGDSSQATTQQATPQNSTPSGSSVQTPGTPSSVPSPNATPRNPNVLPPNLGNLQPPLTPAPTPSAPPASPSPAVVVTPPTPTPAPAPAPSVSGSAGALTAQISVKSQWQGGYCADIIVRNAGSSAVSTWTLVLNLNATKLAQQWNLNVTQNGGSVTMRPIAVWNATIPAGGSVNQQGFCVDTADGSQASVASVQ